MMDIGEIKGSIKIENGIMVLTLAEQERMKLIRRLAVTGEAFVDSNGNMDIHFDLRGDTSKGDDSDAEDVRQEPSVSELLDDMIKAKAQESEGEDGSSENERGEVLELYQGMVDEEEGSVDYEDVVETKTPTGRRSIEELTIEEKEFLVDLYINDIPTKVIMSSENVTKSALYSSLERERIPRKGKLNTIIRRLEDGDRPLEVSSEENVDIEAINRIIKALE